MVTTMPCDPARKRMIRDRAKKQEDDAGGKGELRSAKLTVKGTTSLAPIYKFQLGDLAYNKANGRIKAEVIEKEAELGRILNQFDADDEQIIKDILLAIRRDENDKIREDLRKNTQIFPGIITVDGVVINGNRRKALLEELFAETHDDKYQYLDVHILPSDITKSELWLIEAGIQLSAPQQLDYSPINHLLKLREGINSGLAISQMASRIYGMPEEQFDSDLKRLDLIDEYLTDFLGKEGKYYLVKNLNEHFIDLCKILDWVERPRGAVRRDWTPTKDDINELKLVGLYYIRMHMPHLRIRELRDIFATSSAWQEARRALNVDPNLRSDEKPKFGITPIPEVETFEDADEIEVEDTTRSLAEQRDMQEEAIWQKNRTNELKSIYQDAKEQETIVKDSEKPLALVQRALKNIQGILDVSYTDGGKLNDPEIDQILGEIILLVNRIRKKIKKGKSS
jgi:hypothetical protein